MAYESLVETSELRPLIDQREDVVHPESFAGAIQRGVDLPHQLEICWMIDGPPQLTAVDVTWQELDAKLLGPIEVRRDVLAIRAHVGVATRRGERRKAEALDIETVRELRYRVVKRRAAGGRRRVVIVSALEQREHPTDDLRIDERTVCRDPQHRICGMRFGRLHESIEDIELAPGDAGDLDVVTQRPHRLILRGVRRGDHHVRETRRLAKPIDDVPEHRMPRDQLEL